MNACECLNDPDNDKWYGKKIKHIELMQFKSSNNYDINPKGMIDKKIKFNDDATEILVTTDSIRRSIAVSDNRALKFSSDNIDIRFNLVRTKLYFDILLDDNFGNEYVYSIGGELIDVSIPLDNGLIHFFNDPNNNIEYYELTFDGNKKTIGFNSYDVENLVYDLEYMLFYGDRLPWTQNKYEKRLNRLLYLYFMDLYLYDKDRTFTNTSKIHYLKMLKDVVFNIPSNDIEKDIIIQTIKTLLITYSTLGFNKLLEKYILMIQKEPMNNDFQNFIITCDKNINNFINVTQELIEFEGIRNSGIDEKRLYNTDGDIIYN
jgi:hypothetical protein